MIGCAAQVALAPFPERPETVTPGNLLGPFEGQVVDSATGNPIAGALVYCTWAYEQSPGLLSPVAARDHATQTRADGGYDVPRGLPVEGRASGWLLRRFTLIIYKAGYLGYRSDVRTDDRTPRHDFAQRGVKIKLERFPDGESHARHLAFLGGGMTVQKAAQAEVIQAGLELAEAQAPKKEAALPEPPALPAADTLLTLEDVQKATATQLKFDTVPLADSLGAEDGVTYESTHLRAVGKNESFDAALRLWRPEPRSRDPQAATQAAEALYDKVRGTLRPQDRQDKDEVGDRSLRALDPKRRIRGVVALLKRAAVVIEISCGANLCKKDEQAVRLLTLSAGRVTDTAPAPDPPTQVRPELKLQPLHLGGH